MNEKINKSQRGPLLYAILGVAVLIVAVAGSTYAYYAASVQNTTDVKGQAGGGAAPTMTVTKKSTAATGALIPVGMDATTLSAAAKGYQTKGACVDKNGYTACQIYEVKVTNNSNTAQTYNIALTTLSGANTPNIEAVAMTDISTVGNATSIKGGDICTTNSVAAGGESNACYFMVFIKNLATAQTDKGDFTGTVTATSSTGSQTYAQFS